jgi:uncharacterized protein YajQ (UPF0234 family)
MPSFDIKSEIDKHELTNVVDQANRVLKIGLILKMQMQNLN